MGNLPDLSGKKFGRLLVLERAENHITLGGNIRTAWKCVCDSWNDDFATFRDWSVNNGCDENLTIDRIDVNGDYSPDNCRWVSMKAQGNNRTSNRLITYNDETHTVKEWSEITGISYSKLYMRLRNGWSAGKALTT